MAVNADESPGEQSEGRREIGRSATADFNPTACVDLAARQLRPLPPVGMSEQVHLRLPSTLVRRASSGAPSLT